MKTIFLILLHTLIYCAAYTQEHLADWDFKKEKDGIKVYTRNIENSNLKELRIIFHIDSDLSSVVSLISDIAAYQNWVYRCTMSSNLKRVSELETYDYYRINFPWPFSDRDMIMHSVMSQDPETKVVTSYTTARHQFADTVDGFVRIQSHINKWIFTPISENRLEVDYHLNSDPAGSIPDWLVNMAIDQGPVQSMIKMKQLLESGAYQNKQVIGILNY